MPFRIPLLFPLFLVMAAMLAGCGGSSGSAPAPIHVDPVAGACSRPAAGSVVQNPPELVSRNGELAVNFSYQTTTDADGRSLFCFMTPDGLENPTLTVNPGDHLRVNITNNTPATAAVERLDPPNCGASNQTSSSLNLHLHGTNTSPKCRSDNVVRTLINSGNSFSFDFRFPKDEPPGMYWFHPHVHMLVESALQGGASGAIIVQGIEKFQPSVAGLRQQVLVIRDQNVAGNPPPEGNVPSWDLTLNNIPIAYPAETPAVIRMQPGERQLWRVSNNSADTILDLQVQHDGVAQTLGIVALDGVPTGSQDGTRQGHIVNATDVLLPNGARAEFIVTAPSSGVSDARLVTLAVNTGPDGDNDPQRTIATIQTAAEGGAQAAASAGAALPTATEGAWNERFAALASATPDNTRTLYFSENNPESQFFITVDGATPSLFDPNNPPAIVTTQGSVEDWTIENRTLENHVFHIHQVHFLVLSQDNFEINGSQPPGFIDGQLLDTIEVPFWDGNPDHPYPAVKVRLDFRGADIGDFVYHCHIAEHEDDGMMAVIRVEPSSMAAIFDRMRIGLASLGWFSARDAAAAAWCVRGRTSARPPALGRRSGRLAPTVSSRVPPNFNQSNR